MLSKRMKEEVAYAPVGEFQEETRNVAFVRIQQQEQMFTGKKRKKMERCPDRVHVQQDFALLLQVSK
jgi:hypothetical protein